VGLVGEREGRRQLGNSSHGWEDDIKVGVIYMGWLEEDWI
jgi:hypothetical protein